jgi:protein TonB
MSRRYLSFALILCMAAMTVHAQETVRRLTQEEAVKAAIAKPQPDYPAVARQLKIQGKVELEVAITPAGAVEEVKILTGNASLTGAAVNAMKRWRFEPFTSGGKPVSAIAVISFMFRP